MAVASTGHFSESLARWPPGRESVSPARKALYAVDGMPSVLLTSKAMYDVEVRR